jgi:hypothetical protein
MLVSLTAMMPPRSMPLFKPSKNLPCPTVTPASGHWVNLPPGNLFAEYSALTPLLPNNVQLWVLNLVTKFHDGLSPNLRDMILADTTYLPPNLSLLTT